jgi:tetratricopeptide (TPR) repeat protein
MSPGPRLNLLTVLAIAAVASAQGPSEELTRAMQLAGRGNFQEAEQALRNLEKAYPQEFEVRYRLGLILMREGKTAEAAERLETAIQLDPGSSLGWLAVAQARLKTGRREPALEAAEKAASFASPDPRLWRALALFYDEAGNFERAAEFEERWGRAAPQDTESNLRLCRSLVRAGNSKRALEICRQAATRGETPELYRLIGRAHRLDKDPARAVEAYQSAIRLAPGQPDAYFDLAALFLDHRTPKPAVAVLENAVARFPKEAEFRRLLGLAHYQTGAIGSAIDQFFVVADLTPDSEIGYTSLETLLADAGPRLPEIIKRLRTFRERRPASPVGHFLLARALAIEHRPAEEVEFLLREAIRVEPRFWPAHYELGQLLEGQGKPVEAVHALAQAVKLNPEYAPAHYSLARLYGHLEDRARAIEHRKLHHELLSRQKKAAEMDRAGAPALSYRMEAEPDGSGLAKER